MKKIKNLIIIKVLLFSFLNFFLVKQKNKLNNSISNNSFSKELNDFYKNRDFNQKYLFFLIIKDILDEKKDKIKIKNQDLETKIKKMKSKVSKLSTSNQKLKMKIKNLKNRKEILLILNQELNKKLNI
jgi:TolA-binding protein